MIRAPACEGKNWVQALTLVELAVNNVVLDLNMLSPAHEMFGLSLRTPVDHLDSLHPIQAL